MLQDASIGVLKIFQMFEQISGKRLSQLNERLNLAHQSRWVGKTIPIDTREDYSRISHAFTGIPELLEADQYLVAAAACMPITKLFGRSPAGENATGEHDEANWTAIVESAQEEDYSEPIIKIVKLIAASIGAQDLENWGIKWHPTESHTSKQRLEIEKIVAETDLLRVNLGIEESAMVSWRFGQGEYRSDPPVFSEEEIRSWDSDIPDTEEDPDLPDLDKEEEEEEEEEEEDQNKESN
jgi:phage-related protein (TIGR01555 family)